MSSCPTAAWTLHCTLRAPRTTSTHAERTARQSSPTSSCVSTSSVPSAVELFSQLHPVLGEWPDLLRDFAAFLLPEQALECGPFEEQQACGGFEEVTLPDLEEEDIPPMTGRSWRRKMGSHGIYKECDWPEKDCFCLCHGASHDAKLRRLKMKGCFRCHCNKSSLRLPMASPG
ncbi:GON-4-like protein isoform X3 [Oncorhynchus masou masou]|uniref:GON-4-like protein isoform X3 n=1 Tax=Oncorhynchus masou masou TaxID=90313 RepID=UPI0031831183